MNNVVGMAVSFGKDQSFGHLDPAGKDLWQPVTERADHRADLVRVDDIAIQLLGTVNLVLVLGLPALFAGQAFALLDLLPGSKSATLLGFLGFYQIDLVADVNPVCHGLFVVVLTHHVFAEEAVGAVIRRGGEADKVSVKILDDLAPQVIDRAVAFVDDDDIEELRGNLVVVNHRERLFGGDF